MTSYVITDLGRRVCPSVTFLLLFLFIALPVRAQDLWSDPNTWGGTVPAAGAMVTIPSGQTVVLDVDSAPLNRLMIDGTLRFSDAAVTLTANAVMVRSGGTLQIGTEGARHTASATIVLTGTPATDPGGEMGGKVLGVMMGGTLDLHGAERVAWTRLGATASVGATSITLSESVDWQPGERIAVASTDYDQEQAEERTITAVSGDGKTVSFAEPLTFMHWGTLQTISDPNGASHTLDERAEVALLSRNITIQGDADGLSDGYGGHTMMHHGATARIDGVEFVNLGQQGRLARYPVHFHHGEAASGSYVRRSSIHHSFNRCITIHDTRGVTVEDNAAFDTIGHCYFLEDGAETGNTFRRNLGFFVRAPESSEALLSSDHTFPGPAVFWVTNPDNVYEDNVAAGSVGSGFWLAFPEHPTGPSYDATAWPRRTPLAGFSGNVAHSNGADGLHVDRGPKADLSDTEPTNYAPVTDPSDPESAPVTAYFDDVVTYRNRGRGVWLRGLHHVLRRPILADNAIGATFASDLTTMEDGVVVGESANTGNARPWEEAGLDGRSLPLPWEADFPIRGFEFYDGKVGAVNTLFTDFEPNAQRTASALSALRFTAFFMHPHSYAEGLRFDGATNRVFFNTRPLPSDPDGGEDGYRSTVFLDNDGSVTGQAGRHVTVNNDFLVTSNCTFQSDWNSYVCNEPFRTLLIENRDETRQEIAPLRIRRDGAEHAMLGRPTSGPNYDFRTSLINAKDYALSFPADVPYRLRLRLEHASASDHIVVGVPYAYGGPFIYRDYWIHQSNLLLPTESLSALRAGSGNLYYRTDDSLYVKLQVQTDRDYATLDICASEGCPGTAPGPDTPPVAEGTYRMEVRHSGHALTIGEPHADADLVQHAYLGIADQHWRLTYEGSGIYTIQDAEHNYFLTASGTSEGDALDLRATDAGLASRWRVTDLGDGYFRIASQQGNLAPDVQSRAVQGGRLVQLWTSYDGDNQQWTFMPADGNAAPSVYFNNGFEADGAAAQEPEGWWSWSPNSTLAADQTIQGDAYAGSYYGAHTSGSAYKVSTYQRVTGLPLGRYRVSARVRSSGGQDVARLEIRAADGPPTVTMDLAAAASWTEISTEVDVTTGLLQTGFYSEADGGEWLHFDEVNVTSLDAAALPVELVAFHAQVDGGAVDVRWETATEERNAGFEVQVRSGEAPFEVAAFVEGAGTTTKAQQYHHRLADLAPGTYTLRLKQVDFDGSFSYSPEVEVTVGLATAYRVEPVYPNPFNPAATLRVSVAREQHVTATLFDALGRRVQTLHDGPLAAGTVHPIRIDGADLAAGLYLIRVTGEQFADTQRITLLK